MLPVSKPKLFKGYTMGFMRKLALPHLPEGGAIYFAGDALNVMLPDMGMGEAILYRGECAMGNVPDAVTLMFDRLRALTDKYRERRTIQMSEVSNWTPPKRKGFTKVHRKALSPHIQAQLMRENLTAIHYQPKEKSVTEQAAPQQLPPFYSLSLTADQLNLIGKALSELPYKESGGLIIGLQQEAARQTQAYVDGLNAEKVKGITPVDAGNRDANAYQPDDEAKKAMEEGVAKLRAEAETGELQRTGNPEDEPVTPAATRAITRERLRGQARKRGK